jgi:hypothetical protein
LSEFKKATQGSDDATKATAHLPGRDIEVVRRRSPDGGSEQLSINLQAVPSFEAFGRFLEAANPFALWADTAWLTWFSWLEARPADRPRPRQTCPVSRSDAMGQLERLQIWEDAAIRDALAWYLAVADNRRPAKFRIAATVPMNFDPTCRHGALPLPHS